MRVDVRSDEGGYKRVTALESKGMPRMLMSDRDGRRMRVTDLRDQHHWRRRYGSVESTWLGRSCGTVSTSPKTGSKSPQGNARVLT